VRRRLIISCNLNARQLFLAFDLPPKILKSDVRCSLLFGYILTVRIFGRALDCTY